MSSIYMLVVCFYAAGWHCQPQPGITDRHEVVGPVWDNQQSCDDARDWMTAHNTRNLASGHMRIDCWTKQAPAWSPSD